MPANSKAIKDMNTKTIRAIDEHFSKIKRVTLEGIAYTLPELKAVFQRNTDALNAAEAAHVRLAQLVKAQKASNALTMRVRRALRNYLLSQHGPDALDVLADFGFVRRRASPTVETRSIAVVKMRATRKARLTLGKRQRAKIKGEVPPPSPNARNGKGAPLNGATEPST